MLRRYWIVFKKDGVAPVLDIGCGLTAADETDARNLLEEYVFPRFGRREIEAIVVDVDVSKLDPGHVLPNIGPPAVRGVWFPWLTR